MTTSDNIDELYLYWADALIWDGKKIGNTRELNDVKLQLTDINNNILSVRNISDVYMFAELIWYFAGREDVRFIGSFASLWKKITDDGETNNSAYGCCMKSRYGFNQVDKIIELLKKDPLSRRAIINLNVPNKFVIETKDEPCTIALQFLMRDKKLHCTGMMRSNDMWYGFPYDVIFFTELQKYIALKLEVDTGTYTHFATSLHLYEKDFDKITKIIENPISVPIDFNRSNFYEYYETISNEMDVCLLAGQNPKESLLKLLEKYKIYKPNMMKGESSIYEN